ncbi:MAG: hypothetical protein ACRDJ9_26100 [Dehalococcoidia bacterium]
MRATLTVLGAFLMMAVSVVPAASAGAQPPRYQDQIAAALARLRDSRGDAEAWLELNAGVRAALAADDYRSVMDAGDAAPSIEDELEATGVDFAHATAPEVIEAIFVAIPIALALEEAMANDDHARAREAFRELQAVVEEVSTVAQRLTGSVRLEALVFAAEGSAVSGMDPAFVRQAFASLRDEVLGQVLPQALVRNACRVPARRQLNAAVALATELGGDPWPAVLLFNQRECTGDPAAGDRLIRYSGDGTLDYTQDTEYAGAAYRVRMLGTYTIAFDAPTAGGAIQGSGEADLTVTVEDMAGSADCGGPTRITLPLEVGGSTGEDLEIVIKAEPLPAPDVCSLPAGAPVQLGLPEEIELSVNEQRGFTTNISGGQFRGGSGYHAQWNYRVGLSVQRLL